MKKIFSILLVVSLLCPLVIANTAFAANDSFAKQDLVLAQESAQNYIEEMAAIEIELSQWVDAKAVNPQAYYNLDGKINAYMFEIINNKSIVGHIIMGSVLYKYDMLEASIAEPPTIPDSEAVKKAIETLGLTTSESEFYIPDGFIYIGVDGRYAVYDINKQKIAVNIIFGDAVLVSDLKMTMTAPEDYSTDEKEFSKSKLYSTRSAGYKTLAMYASSGWCGPASGVSIGAYYRDILDYDGLYNNGDMYADLYITMDTYLYEGSTYNYDYGPGFIEMTENCGYYNFTYANDYFITHADYWDVRDGIDAGHPTALLIGSQSHWRAIRGYDYNSDTNKYNIICTNSATPSHYETLNWDALGAFLFTCRIMD